LERPTIVQSTEVAAIVAPGQGLAFAHGDVQTMVKASSQSTLGAFTLLECTLAPGKSGPPLHRHRQTYETLQVLEGELTLRMGEREATIGPGNLAFVPLGVAHAFSNAASKPVRFLVIVAPGGYDDYLLQLANLLAERGAPLPLEVAQELAEQYDVEPV
jgi:quercetin dioxygenase-like cupin family protein